MADHDPKAVLAFIRECEKEIAEAGVKPGAVIAVDRFNLTNRRPYRLRVIAVCPARAVKGFVIVDGWKLRKDGSTYTYPSAGLVLRLDGITVESTS